MAIRPPAFSCSVTNDVLSWTDQGVERYQIQQIIPGNSSFLATVEGATSLDLPGNANFYIVRARVANILRQASCAGNPAPAFTCSVDGEVLSWTDQGQDNYNVRQLRYGINTFLGSTDQLSLAVDGNADTYIVKTNIGGSPTEITCAGDPPPPFACEVNNVAGTFILSWNDQEQDRYQIQQVIDGGQSFLGAVDGNTFEFPIDVLADEYVVRFRSNGVRIDTRCPGVPA